MSESHNQQPRHGLDKTIYNQAFKWELGEFYKLFLYIGFLFILIWNLPNAVWSADYKKWLILFGALGVWRYIWWFTHAFRALIYNQIVFAKLRSECNELLDIGWRPNKVVFMVTVFNESEFILEHMLSSLNREANLIGVSCEVYIATADADAERKIEKVWSWINHSQFIKLNIVRQITPGKRAAIGAALRTISRKGIGYNDPVVFMDGDTVLTSGAVLKSIPIFVIDQKVHAITTNEKNKTHNIPKWLFNWFNLRFTQRNMLMQSHAISRKVLTLTGRLSIFRGGVVLEDDFIYTVEHDKLHHWLWGEFRFLSGDDKSTWYALLKRKADMLYVPDALVYTVEEIDDKPFHRLKENMLRWSGNILRNGWRAIRLGPRTVGLFPWWCLVDQRIIMFTMLAAPILMITGSFLITTSLVAIYLVWVLFSRLCLACVLFYFARRMNMTFPFLLYANQITTAVVKLYLLFRLPMQKWANRGDQQIPLQGGKGLMIARRAMAFYMTLLMIGIIALVAMTYMEFLPFLNFNDIDTWIH